MPPNPKHFSEEHTIVPFPKLVRASKIEPRPLKKTSWIKKQTKKIGFSQDVVTFNTNRHNGKKLLHTARIIKLEKLCTHPLQCVNLSNKNKNIKLDVSKEINDLFHFLGPKHQEPKRDILNLFNQKLLSGEIRNYKDVRKFLRKAEDLADCLNLYLVRNQFCDHFMTEVSLDIFRNGFSPDSQEEIIKKYPNYFSSKK